MGEGDAVKKRREKNCTRQNDRKNYAKGQKYSTREKNIHSLQVGHKKLFSKRSICLNAIVLILKQ